jgi:hypothetical protein
VATSGPEAFLLTAEGPLSQPPNSASAEIPSAKGSAILNPAIVFSPETAELRNKERTTCNSCRVQFAGFVVHPHLA